MVTEEFRSILEKIVCQYEKLYMETSVPKTLISGIVMSVNHIVYLLS